MTLHHPAAVEAPVLDDAPVEMRLPVLPPFGLSQEHGGKDFATRLPILGIRVSLSWSSLQPLLAMFPTSDQAKSNT